MIEASVSVLPGDWERSVYTQPVNLRRWFPRYEGG